MYVCMYVYVDVCMYVYGYSNVFLAARKHSVVIVGLPPCEIVTCEHFHYTYLVFNNITSNYDIEKNVLSSVYLFEKYLHYNFKNIEHTFDHLSYDLAMIFRRSFPRCCVD